MLLFNRQSTKNVYRSVMIDNEMLALHYVNMLKNEQKWKRARFIFPVALVISTILVTLISTQG